MLLRGHCQTLWRSHTEESSSCNGYCVIARVFSFLGARTQLLETQLAYATACSTLMGPERDATCPSVALQRNMLFYLYKYPIYRPLHRSQEPQSFRQTVPVAKRTLSQEGNCADSPIAGDDNLFCEQLATSTDTNAATLPAGERSIRTMIFKSKYNANGTHQSRLHYPYDHKAVL